jgi:hypothetical protein
MLTNPRIRQIMPAPVGLRELVVKRRHPFSDDPDDDIHVWPIVGFALVDKMQPDPNDPHGDAECNCELTRVEYQVVSAIVMTPQYSDIKLMINLVNVDDADWERVQTLQPGDDVDDWMEAAREALLEEKTRITLSCPKCGAGLGLTQRQLAWGQRCPFCKAELGPRQVTS